MIFFILATVENIELAFFNHTKANLKKQIGAYVVEHSGLWGLSPLSDYSKALRDSI